MKRVLFLILAAASSACAQTSPEVRIITDALGDQTGIQGVNTIVMDARAKLRKNTIPSQAPRRAAGQAPTAAAKTWSPPRTPDGQPDVQGHWNYAGPTQTTYDIEGGASELHDIIGGTHSDHISVVVDPSDGKVPYQAWAAVQKKEAKDNYQNPLPIHLDPVARCFVAGAPRSHYQNGPAQILQPPGYVVFLYEWAHAYRIIPLEGRPQPGETIKLWQGASRGRWEGNTLVVDVTNQNDKTWFDLVGDFHSDALHVVERYTLVDADTIRYEATIEDPKVFTRPWKMAFSFARNKREGYELMEHACFEGERSVKLKIMLRPESK